MPQPALLAHDLVRTLGTRRVLDGVSLTASPGHRIGLIGENGVGKSTLLRLLAGVDEPDAGEVTRPADLGFLHQEVPFDATATLADVLDDALREARADLAALDLLTDRLARTPQDSPGYADVLDAYGARLEQARQREAWDADRRAAVVLDGLGLGAIGPERAVGSLSGGLRSRLALAALLVRRPSALLLDEPTNHLDDAAAAFLEEQLRGLPGAVVAASHDRAFLDAVCTDLVDLDPAADGPVRFGGGYRAYQAAKRAERDRWERRYAEEQEELAALRRAAEVTAYRVAPDRERRDNEKMGYGHRAGRVQHQISRRVRNAGRRLAELEREQVAEPPAPLRFRVGALTAASPAGAPGTGGSAAGSAVAEVSGGEVPGGEGSAAGGSAAGSAVAEASDGEVPGGEGSAADSAIAETSVAEDAAAGRPVAGTAADRAPATKTSPNEAPDTGTPAVQTSVAKDTAAGRPVAGTAADRAPAAKTSPAEAPGTGATAAGASAVQASAAGAPGYRTLVSLRDVRVPGRLAVIRLDVSATQRLLVTGGNGAGKSTLLAVLAGRLAAKGEVRRRRGLTVGLLAQDTEFARPERTVADTYELALGEERAALVPLGSLGLMHTADLDKPVGQLSVGQRRRLALALLVARPPELLLLDEPTNHLSPRLCDELEAALGSGPGAVVLASHDRWLRRRWHGPTHHVSPEQA